jgi:hypothetical protein
MWVPVTTERTVTGGDALQIRRVAANIFNKESWTANKGWTSSLGVERGANNSSPLKTQLVTKCHKGPRIQMDTLERQR